MVKKQTKFNEIYFSLQICKFMRVGGFWSI